MLLTTTDRCQPNYAILPCTVSKIFLEYFILTGYNALYLSSFLIYFTFFFHSGLCSYCTSLEKSSPTIAFPQWQPLPLYLLAYFLFLHMSYHKVDIKLVNFLNHRNVTFYVLSTEKQVHNPEKDDYL